MAEMRHDPVQRRWVVISPERGGRPTDYLPDEEKTLQENPFAEGNEDQTPPEITAVRKKNSRANGPGWLIRVVPNKFPAFRVEGELNRHPDGLYDVMNGLGAHETVIESPRREDDLALLPKEHALELGKVWRERITDLMQDQRLKYVLLFRNYRRAAGASLSHPHSQIVATAVTPLTIAEELHSAREHFLRKERCLFCDILHQEREERRRVVVENEYFIAFCPFASRFQYEISIMPKHHQHDFRLVNDIQMAGFMGILQDVTQRLKAALGNPPYNFVLHSAPNTGSMAPRPTYWNTLQWDWHWHAEILPRFGDVAGFEFGTGFFINSTPPEQAAEVLRSVEI